MARIAMTRSTTMSSRRVKPRGREDDRLISVLTVQYTPGPSACSGDGYAGRCAIGAQLGNLSREQRRAAAQARCREERSGTCRAAHVGACKGVSVGEADRAADAD